MSTTHFPGTVRTATPADRAAVLALINAVWRSSDGSPGDREKLMPWNFADARMPNYVVCEIDGAIRGVLGAYPHRIRLGGVELRALGIGQVITQPEFRKRGIMSALLAEVTRAMDNGEYDVSWLSGNRSRYAPFGWDYAGRTVEFGFNGTIAARHGGQAPGARPFDPDTDFALVREHLHGLPNTVLSGGQTTVYAGSKHLGLAVLFPAYMASEDYNMQIVRDGDALPPNPKYTETELFLRPPDHPNEWGCHEAYRNAARDIAIVQSFSPFVLPVVASRYDGEAISEVMNDRMTAQEAAEMAAQRINDDIERNLAEDADLRTRYDEWTTLQQKIDRHRAEGKRVPVDWIKNPFHRTYYRHRGWLAEPDEIAADE